MNRKYYGLIGYLILAIVGLVLVNPKTTGQCVGVGLIWSASAFIEYWKCKHFYKDKIQITK